MEVLLKDTITRLIKEINMLSPIHSSLQIMHTAEAIDSLMAAYCGLRSTEHSMKPEWEGGG